MNGFRHIQDSEVHVHSGVVHIPPLSSILFPDKTILCNDFEINTTNAQPQYQTDRQNSLVSCASFIIASAETTPLYKL